MALPLLLFENMYETATITSSSEASSYPDDNVKDWRISTPYRWKANSVTPPAWVKADQGAGGTLEPDTAAIGGHNIFSAGARWKIQWSTDDIAWNDAFASTTPSTNKPQLVKFSVSGVKRYWRLYLDMAAGNFTVAPQVGIVTLGRRLELPSGGVPLTFDPYGEMAETEWTENENGQPLGANLRYVRKDLTLQIESPGFTKTGFFSPASGLTFDSDFKPHARSKWFWFAWNTDEDATGIYLSRAGTVRHQFVGSTARRSLSLPIQAYVEV